MNQFDCCKVLFWTAKTLIQPRFYWITVSIHSLSKDLWIWKTSVWDPIMKKAKNGFFNLHSLFMVVIPNIGRPSNISLSQNHYVLKNDPSSNHKRSLSTKLLTSSLNQPLSLTLVFTNSNILSGLLS